MALGFYKPESASLKLNIGGTIFETSKFTLTRFNGFFKTMLETPLPMVQNQENCIFIDRDPTHFRFILNFMRDCDVDLPDSETAVKEILKEAKYYLLDGLVEQCKQKLGPEPKMELGTPNNWKFLENYDQVLQVTAHSEKPVLIVFHSIGRGGEMKYPSDLNIPELVKKYQDQLNIYFKNGKKNNKYLPDSEWQFVIYHQGKNLIKCTVDTSSCGNLERLWLGIHQVLNKTSS